MTTKLKRTVGALMIVVPLGVSSYLWPSVGRLLLAVVVTAFIVIWIAVTLSLLTSKGEENDQL